MKITGNHIRKITSYLGGKY